MDDEHCCVLIEKNYLLKKKVLYFVFGLNGSVKLFVWLVWSVWLGLLFNRGVMRSKEANRVLNYITRALASGLIGSAIWLATLFVKLLASSFQCTRFFNRIQEVFFHQYILQWQEVVDVDRLKNMKQEKVSVWTMKGLINVISGLGISTIANYIRDLDNHENEHMDKEITSGKQRLLAAAYQQSPVKLHRRRQSLALHEKGGS